MAEKIMVVVDAELEPIMPQYFKNLAGDMAGIRTGLAEGDAAAVAMNGHKIKGSGASFGFQELTRLGAGIEDSGRADDLDTAARLFAEMEDYVDRLDVVYAGE